MKSKSIKFIELEAKLSPSYLPFFRLHFLGSVFSDIAVDVDPSLSMESEEAAQSESALEKTYEENIKGEKELVEIKGAYDGSGPNYF